MTQKRKKEERKVEEVEEKKKISTAGRSMKLKWE